MSFRIMCVNGIPSHYARVTCIKCDTWIDEDSTRDPGIQRCTNCWIEKEIKKRKKMLNRLGGGRRRMIAQLTNTFIMPTILKVFIVLHIQSYFADQLVNNLPVSTKLNQFILYSCLTHSSHFRYIWTYFSLSYFIIT